MPARNRTLSSEALASIAQIVQALADPAYEPDGLQRDPIDPTPVPAVLTCPKCGRVHADRDEWATARRAHRKHLCEHCGELWRPFDFATIGVPALQPGAVVPFSRVPTHCMVHEGAPLERGGRLVYHVRVGNRGWCVGITGMFWDDMADGDPLPWSTQWGIPWQLEDGEDPELATIVALNLRGDETAGELADHAARGLAHPGDTVPA